MTKDRLPALKEAHKKRRRRSSLFDYDGFPNQGALDFGYRLLVEYEYLSDFLKQANYVRQDIEELRREVERVKKLHSEILSQPLIEHKTRMELDDSIYSIQKLARKTKKNLSEFEVEIDRAQKENPTSAEPRIRQVQYDSLSRIFVDVMFEYNNIQIEHRERCKERFKRQLELTGRSTSDAELESMLEQGDPPIFTQEIDCNQTQQARIMLADIEARHTDILKLEQSITELHSMFMDMAILVENQGEIVNRIDFNVLKAVDFVQLANKHTKKAQVLQNRFRWKRVIFGCVLISVIVIIVGTVVGIMKKSK